MPRPGRPSRPAQLRTMPLVDTESLEVARHHLLTSSGQAKPVQQKRSVLGNLLWSAATWATARHDVLVTVNQLLLLVPIPVVQLQEEALQAEVVVELPGDAMQHVRKIPEGQKQMYHRS